MTGYCEIGSAGPRPFRSELPDLLARECNCAPEDFGKEENILTPSVLCEGQRRYAPDQKFFHMVTLGGNAVITADECLHPFLGEWMKDRMGHWLFEQPNLLPLERELGRFGYTLSMSWHLFLPCAAVAPKENFSVRWLDGGELARFADDPRFPNALCGDGMRPNRLAVCAMDGDRVMGMAGCSEDAPGWYQIGVDVLSDCRSRGVGTYLVTLLKDRLIADGHIPFYGTSLSNLHSWNIALNAGFRPTWVEIGAVRREG